jgi:hypothetical protein
LPAASFARTENVCDPFEMLVYVVGDVQGTQAPPSSLHSKLDPASVEVKVNVALVELTVPLGPLVIDVFGATVSTVQVRVAGVWPTFPAMSFARTENVCEPCARPE